MADWPNGGLNVGGADYPSAPPERWPDHVPPPLIAPHSGGFGGPTGPLPEAPDGRGGRAGATVVVALVVVAVLALAIVAIGALATDDSGDETATDTTIDLSDPEITAPPSEEPIDPTMPTMPSIPDLGPGSGVDPTERAQPLDEVLPSIIEFVEETRGQEFVTEPVVQAVTDEEFVSKLAEAQAEEAASLTDAQVADTALGLIPPGTDLVEIAAQAAESSVLGFYDPETKELYVKGDQITPFVQVIIAHELTHALDDQIFDLARLDAMVEQPDESAFGFLALVEGTASYVQDAFRAQLSAEDEAAYSAEELELGFEQLPSLMGIPAAFLAESQVPYVTGQRFVEALVDAGGTAAIDAAYEAPPITSEQVLDPSAYEAGEAPVGLAPLEVAQDVELGEQGAFGAADLRLLEIVQDPMSALINPDIGLLEPFEGFGGGQYVSWTDGDRSCISLEAIGDDEDGSNAIRDALETWADVLPDAEVSSRVGAGDVPVITATSCA